MENDKVEEDAAKVLYYRHIIISGIIITISVNNFHELNIGSSQQKHKQVFAIICELTLI